MNPIIEVVYLGEDRTALIDESLDSAVRGGLRDQLETQGYYVNAVSRISLSVSNNFYNLSYNVNGRRELLIGNGPIKCTGYIPEDE